MDFLCVAPLLIRMGVGRVSFFAYRCKTAILSHYGTFFKFVLCSETPALPRLTGPCGLRISSSCFSVAPHWVDIWSSVLILSPLCILPAAFSCGKCRSRDFHPSFRVDSCLFRLSLPSWIHLFLFSTALYTWWTIYPFSLFLSFPSLSWDSFSWDSGYLFVSWRYLAIC